MATTAQESGQLAGIVARVCSAKDERGVALYSKNEVLDALLVLLLRKGTPSRLPRALAARFAALSDRATSAGLQDPKAIAKFVEGEMEVSQTLLRAIAEGLVHTRHQQKSRRADGARQLIGASTTRKAPTSAPRVHPMLRLLS